MRRSSCRPDRDSDDMGIKRKIGVALDVALTPFYAVVNYYSCPERAGIVGLARKIRKDREMILRDDEAYNLYTLVRKTSKLEGVLAEVGAYKGGSSALICEAKESASSMFSTPSKVFPSRGGMTSHSHAARWPDAMKRCVNT